ncbi:MAG: glycosyltransferase family 2 protein [Planctomycetota bacterium]
MVSISVVIPVYNCGRYVARAIESVLNQTHPVQEIVVVDDGSTDNSSTVIESYETKVRYIYQQNAGASAARNAGIEAASGNWIAFLDADDEWLPNKIELQVGLLNSNPDIVWVSSNYLRCLCDEKRQKPHLAEKSVIRLLDGKEYFDNFFLAFLKDAWGCTDTMLVKKEVLLETGLFQEDLHQMEDIDLFWKIASSYPTIGYVPQATAIYHLDIEGSLIQNMTDYASYRRMICRHLAASENTDHKTDVTACSVRLLKRWMRSMLFQKQHEQIHKTLTEFDFLLSRKYILTTRLLTLCPGLTAGCLRMISRMVRCFKLRQQLARKPIELNE